MLFVKIYTGAVLMPWVSDVSSIVASFLPGQEDGNAIASVLFGDSNPSAKLPVTFSKTATQIPGANSNQNSLLCPKSEHNQTIPWYQQRGILL
jgi:beta-glucosidase